MENTEPNKTVKEEILKVFKTLNGIQDSEKDDIYKVYIDKCIQDICILTNRNTFVEDLKFEVVDMLSDFYKVNIQPMSAKSEGIGNDFIKSLSEDGRSVTFSNSSETELNALISTNISNNLQLRQKKINRYRLLYRVTCNDKKD